MTQTLVIGVDEAGRGPWAGPVTAAAVVLGPKACPLQLAPVRDSKALTAKR
ncbi:MAG: ribonuclease HII, partial [Burkholderiaceae bacterium]